MKIPQNPAQIIDQMRAWFHPKDRPIILGDNAFIEAKNISVPSTYPSSDRARVFYENDSYWSQDASGLIRPLENKAPNISNYLALPGLRGLWTMGAFDSSGNAFDFSNNVRTLTYNGNPTYNYSGLVPYIAFDGTGDYLSRASESGLAITGAETYVASAVRGLTLGGWFYVSSLGTVMNLIGKRAGGGQLSYFFRKLNTDILNFQVTNDGTNAFGVSSTLTMTINTFIFAIARFKPSSELKIWFNDTTYTNTTSIPASIFNSTAPFQISGYNGTSELLTGGASLCFLCAEALSDDMIENLYLSDKAAYGIVG